MTPTTVRSTPKSGHPRLNHTLNKRAKIPYVVEQGSTTVMTDWKRLSECVRVASQWVTLVGERWLCDKGQELEYWRVEKADSVIVLPRPGICSVLRRPFGPASVEPRWISRAAGCRPARRRGTPSPKEVVPFLLQRELGVVPEAFSNQGLWAFVAEIDEAFAIPQDMIGVKAPADAAGVAALLSQLDCLQCRAVLREWQQREPWASQ